MTHRILIRMSLNNDLASHVRNEVERRLGIEGIPRRPGTTGTWEGTGLDSDALKGVANILTDLAEPSKITAGAAPHVSVDHLWLYVDHD